ncbi:MAG: hypothetical protein EON54_07745 [Alcaligenaceae bacterium]|nr:MAG: hypothetical protein EON54_07745 [Alcaligenaceae bacterium]
MTFLKSLFHKDPESSPVVGFVMVEPQDVVRIVNARMISAAVGGHVASQDDPYVHYQIPRPTRREIAEAGSRALRKISASS